ncbi:MAG: nuclear transport factor 2 family protein [Spirochaetia bacterium]|jgi:ketosteroid isomerase-like protein
MADQLSKEEQNALDVVKKMYAAFAKGDMNAVLDLQADDVVWYVGEGDRGAKTSPDPRLPYAGTFKGRDGLQRFFKILDETTRFRSYEQTEFVVQGQTVVVILHDQAHAKPTQTDYDTWLVHKCVVRGGKIASLWNHIDTGPIWAAFGKK